MIITTWAAVLKNSVDERVLVYGSAGRPDIIVHGICVSVEL